MAALETRLVKVCPISLHKLVNIAKLFLHCNAKLFPFYLNIIKFQPDVLDYLDLVPSCKEQIYFGYLNIS